MASADSCLTRSPASPFASMLRRGSARRARAGSRKRRTSSEPSEVLEQVGHRQEGSVMGAFNINITGVGGHGCDRVTKTGQKLYGRCGKFTCPDCMAYDFTQRLKQAGMLQEGGTANSIELQEGDPVPAGAREYIEPFEGGSGGPLGGRKRHAIFPQKAEFTHWPGQRDQVVDDMLKN